MSSNTDNNPDLQEVDSDPLEGVPDMDAEVEDRDESEIMRDQIELLESQLQEKEDLVFALTERLEQAAEQLDRYRRNGAKQGRAAGGGMPAELVAEQKTLFEEMRQMITQWEASQPGATLGRIEMQVTELRDLVAGNVVGSDLRNAVSSIIETPGNTTDSEPQADTSPASDAAANYEPGSWEAQKAALLGEAVATPAAPEPPPAEPPAEEETCEAPENDAEADSDTPTPINLEEADIEQLRQAVLERDRIIASLKDRLQQGGGASGPVEKYDSMESMPDEFREKLEALEEEWKEKIRETEVELSLERAKIAREKAELQQQQHQMQKQREKLGIGNQAGKEGEASSSEEAGGGRWLRFLKRSNDDES